MAESVDRIGRMVTQRSSIRTVVASVVMARFLRWIHILRHLFTGGNWESPLTDRGNYLVPRAINRGGRVTAAARFELRSSARVAMKPLQSADNLAAYMNDHSTRPPPP
jgi:hypothetical protein